jgi:hypothetical protein
MTMILDGHTGVEHALPIAPLYKDALTVFARSHTQYTPTLIVGYGGICGENYWYQHSNVYANEKLLRFTPRAHRPARAAACSSPRMTSITSSWRRPSRIM